MYSYALTQFNDLNLKYLFEQDMIKSLRKKKILKLQRSNKIYILYIYICVFLNNIKISLENLI